MIFTEEDLNNFKNSLSERNRSDKTKDAYISDLKQFFNYLSEENIDEIHKKVMDSYRQYLLYDKFLEPTSVNRKLTSIRRFLEFKEIAVQIYPVKVQSQNFLENVFSKDDITRMTDAAKANDDYKAIALFKLLSKTGMRVSEALQMKVTDIREPEIRINGKGDKSRVVLLTNTVQKHLVEYCVKERKFMKKAKETDLLFIGIRGPMSRSGVDRMIKKYAELAGVDYSKAHAHSFRHSFGKKLGVKNIPIHTIADFLGHSSVETTRIYLKSTKEELKSILESLD